MANTQNPHSVKLTDRTLWFDGSVTVDAGRVLHALTQGVPAAQLYVNELTPDIRQYNQFADDKIAVKQEVGEIVSTWTIPEDFQTLAVKEHILQLLPAELENLSDNEAKARIQRVLAELELYESLGNTPILRVLIFIINTLNEKHIMWGVGRGSSVASYVLYLIGVHDIDSVKYNLDVTDFLR